MTRWRNEACQPLYKVPRVADPDRGPLEQGGSQALTPVWDGPGAQLSEIDVRPGHWASQPEAKRSLASATPPVIKC